MKKEKNRTKKAGEDAEKEEKEGEGENEVGNEGIRAGQEVGRWKK